MKTAIAIAKGDGIGPEIMEATLHILLSAGAEIAPQELRFHNGVPEWETLRNTKAFLKGPFTTPQGGGFKSLNVMIRTTLGLYANVRPCVSYYPFVNTKHPEMDVVIVRENEEDLYAGIEYRQTPDVCCSLKIISRAGCEKIIRYAFEYAKSHNRKKVTCFSKDNIMKFSDGLFHKVFDEISEQYPEILNEHYIVDIGAARLADTPEIFDVIVMPNLYGDILSDVAAQITGSVGLAGSANIGPQHAMFEAIHGSAPNIAGKNIANPSGLLLAAIQMLAHIGQAEMAQKIHNAWLLTLEQGIHTPDIYNEQTSKKKVGTQEFAKAVIDNLGQMPQTLQPVEYKKKQESSVTVTQTNPKRDLVGIDIYLYHRGTLNDFLAKIQKINIGSLRLQMITNRGVAVWPHGQPETTTIEQWRCRFLADDTRPCPQDHCIQIIHSFDRINLDVIKSEHLYTLEGKPGYSM